MPTAKTSSRPVRAKVAAKKRRPRDGGYPRGDETRAKIIEAGLEVFSSHGFEGASTRKLAERAGVNLPALQYYFDGKEGVYLACAEYIAEQIKKRLGPVVERIARENSRKDIPRSELVDLLWDFLSAYCDLFLGTGEMERWVLFVVREQAHPTKAFDIIFERMMRPAAGVCFAVVGRLLDLPAGDPKTITRALSLLGQIMIFRIGREVSLRVLGWPDFDGDRLALIKSILREQVLVAFATSARKPNRGKK